MFNVYIALFPVMILLNYFYYFTGNCRLLFLRKEETYESICEDLRGSSGKAGMHAVKTCGHVLFWTSFSIFHLLALIFIVSGHLWKTWTKTREFSKRLSGLRQSRARISSFQRYDWFRFRIVDFFLKGYSDISYICTRFWTCGWYKMSFHPRVKMFMG